MASQLTSPQWVKTKFDISELYGSIDVDNAALN